MASHDNGEWSRGEDLIDFEVGSPDIAQSILTTTRLLDEENISETLLDSELLRLEKTLQTASSTPQHCRSRCDSRDSVELEQILITIDDDDVIVHRDACATSSRRNSLCNNLEVADALEELDKIINESVNSSNCDQDHLEDEVDGLVNNDESIPSVEDCLRDLDTYLQGFDTSGSETADPESVLSNSVSRQEQLQKIYNASAERFHQDQPLGITERLRNLASRSKSLRHGKFNQGYEPTEQTQEGNMSSKRPLSADWDQVLKRNHRFRSTIAVCGRSVPCVTSENNCVPNGHQMEYDTDDEEIDWSWVQDVVRDGTLEVPCATGSTSTVTAPLDEQNNEPAPSVQVVASSSSQPDITLPAAAAATAGMEDKDEEDPSRARGSSWLRTSMRRVRHFRLPSDPVASEVETVVATASSTPNVLHDTSASPVVQPALANRELQRPVSAPIRTTGVDRRSSESVVNRSRSRSRASEVSTVPGGRARSSSESTRSRRRPRSLSSSESSLASSVDSSPSCTPAASPTQHPVTAAPAAEAIPVGASRR